MLLCLCKSTARSSLRRSLALPLPSNQRNLSIKEKQKRKMPQPKSFVGITLRAKAHHPGISTDIVGILCLHHQEQAEYDKQYAIVQDLKAKCDAVTAEITPLQRREADLRKKEYELWQEVRAIKRTFLEGNPQRKAGYLQWELKQRAQRDKEERAGLIKPQ